VLNAPRMEKDQRDRRLGDFPLSAQESPASLPSASLPPLLRESRVAALKFLFSLSLQLARAHGFPPEP